jgi:hypothetical protein
VFIIQSSLNKYRNIKKILHNQINI